LTNLNLTLKGNLRPYSAAELWMVGSGKAPANVQTGVPNPSATGRANVLQNVSFVKLGDIYVFKDFTTTVNEISLSLQQKKGIFS
jgi:hypothetical protein